MKTLLAVDLEGTIIPHWDVMDTYINFDKLNRIIEEYDPDDWLVYSYAVWNSDNYNILRNSQLIKDLSALSKRGYIPIETTTTMSISWVKLHKHNFAEVSNTAIWSIPKEFAFLMTVRDMIEGGSDFGRYVLFDDTAPHGIKYTINGVEVIFLNPNNM